MMILNADERPVSMICESQKSVVDFLSSAKTFHGQPVERIDTHLSHIFLVGDRAYKIKRAVRYNFVDFSTVERRHQACEHEVEINRRTAPEMYLGATPIYCDGSQVSWTGEGEPVEWAVKMVRFDTDQQLDNLLDAGALTVEAVETLADKIASFHLAAAPVGMLHPTTGVESTIAQLSESFNACALSSQAKHNLDAWKKCALDAYEKCAAFLTSRRRHGYVRRCHGDLHLANVCMFNGSPTLFDAIEFNDDLANIDVLYDLAFVLMDLIRFDHSDLANTLLNRYLSVTCDYSGLRTLALFQSVRAMVRAMVYSLPSRAEQSNALADRYAALASDILGPQQTPRLIAVSGFSGSGKSVLARALAPRLGGKNGAILLQSDMVRKRLLARQPKERLGSEAYTPAISKDVYHRIFKFAGRALRAGWTVILDATFLDAEARHGAAALADKTNVRFEGFWLHAPPSVLSERVARRRNDISDASVSVLKTQLENTIEPASWAKIDASQSSAHTLKEALAYLGRSE